jgi:hypothetical protein
MRPCKYFDRYRDNELNPAEREQFERHFAACPDCRMKKSLIENIALVLKLEKTATQPDLADGIALRAFAQRKTWESMVVSWLRPGPALATLTLTILIFSFLLVAFNRQPLNINYYETLMNEAESLNLSPTEIGTENELTLWMEQEGYAQ